MKLILRRILYLFITILRFYLLKLLFLVDISSRKIIPIILIMFLSTILTITL